MIHDVLTVPRTPQQQRHRHVTPCDAPDVAAVAATPVNATINANAGAGNGTIKYSTSIG